MQGTLRTAHLVVGAVAVAAFVITGIILYILYILYAAVAGSLLALASAALLFFALFAEPMAEREPGLLSAFGLYALFGGVAVLVLATPWRVRARSLT